MLYWNQSNFKGLKDIGEKYLSKNGYVDFANYCLLKEKGLRKEAFKAIENFISSTSCKSAIEQREVATELITISYFNKDVHQLIPNQLHQFLISIFKNWEEEDSNNVIPQRWLGYLTRDIAYYEKALAVDPCDEISIIALIHDSLNSIDFQTHHLSESRFIGNINDSKFSLERTAELIEKLESGELRNKLYEEYQYFTRLINMWEKYKQELHTISFPEWCASAGESFNLWNTIYYNN